MNTESSHNWAATRDWVAVSTFFFLLALLLMHSFSSTAYNATKTRSKTGFKIAIEVVISDEKTLHLFLPYGSTVADVLNHIPISASVDIEKRFMEEKLCQERPFLVPEKNKTTVYVRGAESKNKLYRLPEGSTYKDLLSLLVSDLDIKKSGVCRRRRALREGEIIDVHSKKTRK